MPATPQEILLLQKLSATPTEEKVNTLQTLASGSTASPPTTVTPPSIPESSPVPFPFVPQGEFDPKANPLLTYSENLAAKAARNFPSSATNLAKDTYESVRHLPTTATALGKIVLGALDELGNYNTPLAVDTPNAQLFRQVVQQVKDRYSNPLKTAVEDPAGVLLDFSGILSAAGKTTQAARLAQIAEKVNPIQAAAKVMGATKQITETAIPSVFSQLFKLGSGEDSEAFIQAFKSGQSPDALKAYHQAVLTKTPPEVLLDTFEGIKERLREKQLADFRQELPNLSLKDPQLPPDLTKIKKAFIDELKKPSSEGGWNVRPIYNFSRDLMGFDFSNSSLVSRNAEQAKVLKAWQTMSQWQDNSPQGLDVLKQALDGLYTRGGNSQNFKRSNAIIEKARDGISQELQSKVEGYPELEKNFSDAAKFINRLEIELSIGGQNPNTTVKNITSALRSNNKMKGTLVKELEDISGQPLSAQIAGMELASLFPKGLFGRGLLLGGAGTYGAGWIGPQILAALPLTSPAIAGEFMAALGVGSRGIKATEDYIKLIHAKIPPGMITDGLTLGAITSRIDGVFPIDTPAEAIGPQEPQIEYKIRGLTRGNTPLYKIVTKQSRELLQP